MIVVKLPGSEVKVESEDEFLVNPGRVSGLGVT
jgi:hypothetical protein